MARSIETIAQGMLDYIKADGILSKVLYSTSNKSIFRKWIYVIAYGISLAEQLLDLFRKQSETSVEENNAVGTSYYLRFVSLKFQYNPNDPQSIQAVINKKGNIVIMYKKLDVTLRIINICSLNISSTLVIFNVASIDDNQNITTLTASQLGSFQAYINSLSPPAGNIYKAQSLPADKVYFEANIIYKNSYNAATVLANITAAVIKYLNSVINTNVPNNPIVNLSDFLSAVTEADGVVNFTDGGIINLFFRPDSVPLLNPNGAGFNPDQNLIRFISSTDIMKVTTQLVAGYCIPETTTDYTFTNKITLTSN